MNGILTYRKEVAKNTIEIGVKFSTPPNFTSGQYVYLSIPDLVDPIRGSGRDFSIISLPGEKTLSFVTRASASPFKHALMTLPIGSTLACDGPFGSFLLPENTVESIVFIAGGIGIAPFLSMLRSFESLHRPHKIVLLYGNKDESSVAFLSELALFEKNIPDFSYHLIYGPIDVGSIRKNIPNPEGFMWYVAGPPMMVATVQYALGDMGISPVSIRTELFSGYISGIQEEDAPIPNVIVSNDERSKAILEALSELILVSETDLDGTITYVNDKFIEVSQYSREELIGKNHRILKSGEHSDSFFQNLWQTISHGKVFRGEIKNRAKDGSFYWVDVNIAPIFDKKGRIIRYTAIRFLITDRKIKEEEMRQFADELRRANITTEDRKRALLNILEDARALEQSLRDERERLTTVLSSIGEGLFVVDDHFCITLINPIALNFFGRTARDVIGKNVHDVVKVWNKDTEIADALRPVERVMMEKNTVIITLDDDMYYVAHGGKKVPISLTATALGTEGVLGVVVVFRDITIEKQLDETKSGFISVASHQLRTPLTSIRWYAEMLLNGDMGELTIDQKDFAQQIYDGAVRLYSTIDMLLSITRIEAGNVLEQASEIDFNAFIQKIVTDMKPLFEQKELKVVTNFSLSARFVYIDTFMLREVFSNLIANSIRYTNNTGEIIISVVDANDELKVSISDNGIGIPANQRTRVFSKFFRADNAMRKAPDGTGLGLALVKGFIEKWGGRIWFDSEEGKGTTFYFTIPEFRIIRRVANPPSSVNSTPPAPETPAIGSLNDASQQG